MEYAFEVTPLIACKLIVYTFGSLTHLFLMVLVIGQRRLRVFEWLLFWLMAGLFMWNSGNLLSLNVGLHYGVGPPGLAGVSRAIPFVGLIISVPLLVHAHVEYGARFGPATNIWKAVCLVFYLPLLVTPSVAWKLLANINQDALLVLHPYVKPAAAWAGGALAAACALNAGFVRKEGNVRGSRLHLWLAVLQGVLAVGLVARFVFGPAPVVTLGGYISTSLMLVAILPGVLIVFAIFRHNFLELRVQRNLVYTILGGFGLLLYLDVVRRVGSYLQWKGILPEVVTESVMIFVLVVLLEPAKKLIDRALRAAFTTEFEKVQKLSAEIQECAKEYGDVEALKKIVAERVPQQLHLERATLIAAPERVEGFSGKTRRFAIHHGEGVIGALEVTAVTSDLSGDQAAALQLLADQLAAALELCRLISDKVKLERELAEKAKMAFLGEMAARIAHNVKNPLSSIKTLVQLLEEDSTLPERVKHDCRMVTSEVDRLNANISQVLRYAKPARDADRPVDLAVVVKRILELTGADADRRGVRLSLNLPEGSWQVEGGDEAASDIVSNLVVNALDATPVGKGVKVSVEKGSAENAFVALSVEDEGPGISTELREKIFQPFVTTRPGGTGLGLAIVARRAEEIGGWVHCESPLTTQGGSRFEVRFRAAAARVEKKTVSQPSPF